MFNRKGNDKEQVELKEILDKLLELEKEKQKCGTECKHKKE